MINKESIFRVAVWKERKTSKAFVCSVDAKECVRTLAASVCSALTSMFGHFVSSFLSCPLLKNILLTYPGTQGGGMNGSYKVDCGLADDKEEKFSMLKTS